MLWALGELGCENYSKLYFCQSAIFDYFRLKIVSRTNDKEELPIMIDDLAKEMKEKAYSELEKIVENPDKYSDEQILAAKIEIAERDRISEEKAALTMEEQDDSETAGYFPKKPEEPSKQQSLNRSLVSMLIFIATFYIVFQWEIIYILVLAGVIFIHELGHYLAMRLFKYKDLGIFFVPLLGAFASGTKENISQKQRVVVILSGPLPGIVLGLALYYLGLSSGNDFFIRSANIFIFVNLFNLLPIMPLDGGQMIKCLFFETNDKINRIFIYISIALLVGLAIYTRSYVFLIVPVFLTMRLANQSRIQAVRDAATEKGLNLNRNYEELTDEEYWLIRDEIGTQMKQFQKVISPRTYEVTIFESKIIQVVKAIIQKNPIADLHTVGKIVVVLLWLFSFIAPLIVIALFYISLGIEFGA